ncbi:hypothetical protein [Flavobacterium bernardetii]|nr:hypothetical protein [Flavobacterium bernardetii]
MKNILKITLQAFVLFCVISFLSLSYSMINSRLNSISPNLTIGFPFEMYYQFEVKGECDERTLLHGAHFINIIYNFIICFIIIAFINYKQQTKNNNQ